MNIRQGDVRLKSIKELPKGAKKLKDKTLAYGEVTGHSHRFINADSINRYEFDGKLYLQVLESVGLTHEEHNQWKAWNGEGYIPHTGMILPGTYEQIAEQEYDYINEETKKVVD